MTHLHQPTTTWVLALHTAGPGLAELAEHTPCAAGLFLTVEEDVTPPPYAQGHNSIAPLLVTSRPR